MKIKVAVGDLCVDSYKNLEDDIKDKKPFNITADKSGVVYEYGTVTDSICLHVESRDHGLMMYLRKEDALFFATSLLEIAKSLK